MFISALLLANKLYLIGVVIKIMYLIDSAVWNSNVFNYLNRSSSSATWDWIVIKFTMFSHLTVMITKIANTSSPGSKIVSCHTLLV